MSSEYWNGWFDSWGLYHHAMPVAESAADLDALLATGASVNLYMVHGGTNFGLTNGANDRGVYQPIATSYDYDAPISESGQPTAKYWAFREVIGRYTELPADAPVEAGAAPTGDVALTSRRPLLDGTVALPTVARPDEDSGRPLTFAEAGSDSTMLVHEAAVRRETPTVLVVGEVRDHVTVVVDGRVVGRLARDSRERALTLPPIESTLVLLVEDQGRVNYGPRLGEDKGLIGETLLLDAGSAGAPELPQPAWSTRPVREHDLLALSVGVLDVAGDASPAAPIPALTVAGGAFDADTRDDRFLDTSGLGRGIAWINGFCLGRYWSRGPQRTLYVPGPILRTDAPNDLVVLELATAPTGAVRFVSGPDLGPVED